MQPQIELKTKNSFVTSPSVMPHRINIWRAPVTRKMVTGCSPPSDFTTPFERNARYPSSGRSASALSLTQLGAFGSFPPAPVGKKPNPPFSAPGPAPYQPLPQLNKATTQKERTRRAPWRLYGGRPETTFHTAHMNTAHDLDLSPNSPQ